MLQGVCVDRGQTEVLEKGKTYYLFPNGDNHYYVSNFPNEHAHKGCFHSKYFQILEQELYPPESENRVIHLDQEKIYKANLIWVSPGYKLFTSKEYYIKPRKTHGDCYHDKHLTKLGGCLPLHWFDNFIEIDINVPTMDETVIETKEIKPILTKTVHVVITSELSEQLSLF